MIPAPDRYETEDRILYVVPTSREALEQADVEIAAPPDAELRIEFGAALDDGMDVHPFVEVDYWNGAFWQWAMPNYSSWHVSGHLGRIAHAANNSLLKQHCRATIPDFDRLWDKAERDLKAAMAGNSS